MNQKELSQLLKLLRAQGVQTFKMDGTEIHLFEDKPQSNYKKRTEPIEEEEREMTYDEQLYYSSISPLEQQQS